MSEEESKNLLEENKKLKSILDSLVSNRNPLVRLELSKEGYGLDKLIKDGNIYVKEEAIKQMNKMKNLQS